MGYEQDCMYKQNVCPAFNFFRVWLPHQMGYLPRLPFLRWRFSNFLILKCANTFILHICTSVKKGSPHGTFNTCYKSTYIVQLNRIPTYNFILSFLQIEWSLHINGGSFHMAMAGSTGQGLVFVSSFHVAWPQGFDRLGKYDGLI